MGLFYTSMEIDGVEDVAIAVDYVCVEASGDGWNEPAVPAHIEIQSVTTVDGIEITLTTEQVRAMEGYINEWLNAMYEQESTDYRE